MLKQVRRLAKYTRDTVLANLPQVVPGGSSLVLAYHNVVGLADTGFGDSSLHLWANSLAEQLRVVSEEADLVSLPELLAVHSRPGRRVAISFDDAYLGSIRLGMPICQAAGVKPTVFVAPALLGKFAPWDVRAASGKWSASERKEFLVKDRGVASEAAVDRCGSIPDDYRIATLLELSTCVKQYPVDLGNHTMRHVNLAMMSQAEAQSEVRLAQEFLEGEFGSLAVRYLAFPYGEAPAPAVAPALAKETEAAFLVSGGWIRALRGEDQHSRLALNRMNVPAGVSINYFRAKLRGWL